MSRSRREQRSSGANKPSRSDSKDAAAFKQRSTINFLITHPLSLTAHGSRETPTPAVVLFFFALRRDYNLLLQPTVPGSEYSHTL